MSGYSGSAIQVEHQCPQCGGPVILEESDRFISCSFCRVNLFIMYGDYLRYYLPPATQPLEETLFVPYWRFRGMRFSVVSFNVRHKLLDTNFIASDYRFMPVSMGFRAQALKVKFASSKMKTCLLKPGLSRSEAISRVEKRTGFSGNSRGNSETFHDAFIGETVSIIYSPVYLKNDDLYDGVLDRPMSRISGEMQERLRECNEKREWEISFISALCPHCGGDLTGARDSIVLICRNCDSAWHPVRGRMERVGFRVFGGRGPGSVHLPFWKMGADVRGLELSSFGDFIRTANLPRVVTPVLEDKKLYFYLPAFRVHPGIFLGLGSRMTIIQPDGEGREEFLGTTPSPVALDDREAFGALKVLIAYMTAAKRRMFPLLPDVEISPGEAALVYFPFKVRSSELIHAQYRFSIPRNAIRDLELPGP